MMSKEAEAEWKRDAKEAEAAAAEETETEWKRDAKASEEADLGWAQSASVRAREEKMGGEIGLTQKEEVHIEYEDDFARGRRKNGSRLTGSMAAKITVFFLFLICCFIGLGSGLACIFIAEEGGYSDLNEMLKNGMYQESRRVIYQVTSRLEQGDEKAAEEICREQNIDFDLVWPMDDEGRERVLWSTWDGYDTDLKMVWYFNFRKNNLSDEVVLNHHTLNGNEKYMYRIYINTAFPKEDNFKKIAEAYSFLYEIRFVLIGTAAGGLLFSIICFLFLMCGAGHRNGYRQIVSGVLTGLHLDVLAALFVSGEIIFLYFFLETGSSFDIYPALLLAAVMVTVMAGWFVIFAMDFAIRVKRGNFWRHSLIYAVLHGFKGLVCFLGRGAAVLVKEIPTVMMTMICFLGICILEFFWISVFVRRPEGVLLWGFEKVVLLGVVLYVALTCKRLLRASRALAEGQENYKVDTWGMFGDFKEHGEKLNSLGQGISIAVAERMKSEHLKTELITNVSHDLKTPLTSIINYAELICEEAMGDFSLRMAGGVRKESEDTENIAIQNDRIAEYAEVLLRQSRRLKKLLEDLVEASKAATGNLEVNPEPCEAGVLLSQAVGEYQKKMEEKGLELVARQPEETVRIMADGRYLWRVFDNLLNNICKYAQEHSRVYLSVEEKEGNILIIFRNMSKYPLEVSAEDLKERFVRGDKSRHMEGNGLGLSIAQSLMELQGGNMEIVTDGDLFKVILTFRKI